MRSVRQVLPLADRRRFSEEPDELIDTLRGGSEISSTRYSGAASVRSSKYD
jgi:hypothetical protein